MENLKDSHLKHLRVKHLASFATQCLVLLILPNFEKNLVARNGNYLLYLSGMFKAYLKVPRLELLKAVIHTVQLVNLN